MFTDANDNPVSGITGVGSAPPSPPSPAGLTLTSAVTTNLVGATESVTAVLTDSMGAAMPNTVVSFKVLSGPNVGVSGGGVTNANGQAVFSYIGKGGAGTDTVQASLGTLVSNVFSNAWTVHSLPSSSGCNGTFNGTFNGNVTVTSGQNCILEGGKVTGNITVNGGTLSLSDFIVGGNVQVQGSGSLSTGPSVTINGNLQLQSLLASAPPSQVCGTNIQGNVQMQSNAAVVHVGSVSGCGGNLIGGSLTVRSNAGATMIVGNTINTSLTDQSNTGPTQVFNNTVSGLLQCSLNTSITGGGNTAGQKTGQCAAF